MKFNFKKFIIVLIIELAILLIGNLIANQYIIYNTRMAAGSFSYYAPLVFLEKVYSNSNLLRGGFYLINFIIDIIIILAIASLFAFSKKENN